MRTPFTAKELFKSPLSILVLYFVLLSIGLVTGIILKVPVSHRYPQKKKKMLPIPNHNAGFLLVNSLEEDNGPHGPLSPEGRMWALCSAVSVSPPEGNKLSLQLF